MLPDYRHLIHDLPRLDLTTPLARNGPPWEYVCAYRLNFAERLPGTVQYLGVLEVMTYRVAVQVFMPAQPRGTVWITHGYFDHVGIYDHLIDVLLRAGWAVVAWDMPGHGLSTGERAAIDSFDEYIHAYQSVLTHLDNAVPRPWLGVGQSTGGAVMLGWLFQCAREARDPLLTRSVLLAPLVRPHRWWWIHWRYRLGHRRIARVRRRFASNTDNPGFLDFIARKDPLQPKYVMTSWIGAMRDWIHGFADQPVIDHPTLILQGEADTTVDWRYNLRHIACHLSRVTVRTFPKARHHMVNEVRPLRQKMFAALLAFLEETE